MKSSQTNFVFDVVVSVEILYETTNYVVVGKVAGHVKKSFAGEVVDGGVDGDFVLLEEKDGRHEVPTRDFGKVGNGGRRENLRDEIFRGVICCFVVGVWFVGGGIIFVGGRCGNDVFGVGVFGVDYYVVVVWFYVCCIVLFFVNV
jgi:hypothetical protein